MILFFKIDLSLSKNNLMAEEITDEKLTLLEEKLRSLARLLTQRKMDWTQFSIVNNNHLLNILQNPAYKESRSYFTFTAEKVDPKKGNLYAFVINVISARNCGGIFFNILKDGKVKVEYEYDRYSVGKDFQFPSLLLERMGEDTPSLLKALEKEIAEQKEIVRFISR